jgi:deoxyadenosine/deoxycytidine kinase
MKNRIEICGNIASGKTTLCQGMAKKGYLPIFEDFQINPFFKDFYTDPVAYSFETEVTFLLQHYNLIKKQKGEALLASDYSLLLDMAYADVNLAGNRLKIFFEIVTELQKELGLPSKIIHLVCPEEVLLKRIIRRSREAETSITIEYLNSLSKAISLRVKDFPSQVPVLTIDSHAIDFTRGIEDIQELEPIFP